MKGYHDDIEAATDGNEDFRRVLYTGHNLQLVLMSIPPGCEIGAEVHGDRDQFFRFEAGEGEVIIDDNTYAVKAEDTADHAMHAEWGRIDAATAERLNAARVAGGRLIAVGTTSLRLLESAARDDGTIEPFEGDTAIFITPGYRFKAIDGLMTNFHLPKSTLFMLVSALMGRERMLAAYGHAIEEEYRFYSYGDSSLLLP